MYLKITDVEAPWNVSVTIFQPRGMEILVLYGVETVPD